MLWTFDQFLKIMLIDLCFARSIKMSTIKVQQLLIKYISIFEITHTRGNWFLYEISLSSINIISVKILLCLLQGKPKNMCLTICTIHLALHTCRYCINELKQFMYIVNITFKLLYVCFGIIHDILITNT